MKPSAADAIIFRTSKSKLEVLVIKRLYDPFKDQVAFPGGFIEAGETPLAACQRELAEETGLFINTNEFIPLTTRTINRRDPRGEISSYPFVAILNHNYDLKAGDDAKEALWVDIFDLEELAFDHGAILCEAISIYWPYFKYKFSSSLKLPKSFDYEKIKPAQEVVLFGGSFSPWHEGHEACLRVCPNKNIIIIPDTSPWKSGGEDKCYWSELRPIIKVADRHNNVIYPGNWGSQSALATVDWLCDLPFTKKALLVGDDTFMHLHDWQDVQLLLQSLVKIYVVPRVASADEIDNQCHKIKSMHPLEILICDDHEFKHLSSSEIRSKN